MSVSEFRKTFGQGRDDAKGRNDWSPGDGSRDAGQGLPTAEIRAAMEKKAQEFRDHGGEIYLPKDAAE